MNVTFAPRLHQVYPGRGPSRVGPSRTVAVQGTRKARPRTAARHATQPTKSHQSLPSRAETATADHLPTTAKQPCCNLRLPPPPHRLRRRSTALHRRSEPQQRHRRRGRHFGEPRYKRLGLRCEGSGRHSAVLSKRHRVRVRANPGDNCDVEAEVEAIPAPGRDATNGP